MNNLNELEKNYNELLQKYTNLMNFFDLLKNDEELNGLFMWQIMDYLYKNNKTDITNMLEKIIL